MTLRYRASTDLEPIIEQLTTDQIASKLTAADPTLWGSAAESEASIRLSWVGLAESSRPLLAEIEALHAELREEGLDRIVLAGMGGSSLAPAVICASFGVPLITLDTTDPGQVHAALDGDLKRTVLVVSSKSGGTVETDSHRRVFEKAFRDSGIDPARRIVVVTDPNSPLYELAMESSYRKVFLADPHVGGRYSALTAFGLVPAGLAGADIGALLDDAADIAPTLALDERTNPALALAAILSAAQEARAEKLVLADEGWPHKGFGDWVEQLLAESTGKDGIGVLPVVVESPQSVGFVDAGRDCVKVSLGGAVPDGGSDYAVAVGGELGAQFLLWEYATAIAGRLLGINPFDQPNVEEAKTQTRSLLDTQDHAAPKSHSIEPIATDGAVEIYAHGDWLGNARDLRGALDALTAAVPVHGYVAVMAYLNRSDDGAVREVRTLLGAKRSVQTTFGWGPRFLHSAGQYHKGGHQNGAFLQITAECAHDLEIPDKPYTFHNLQLAQAAGDAAVLAGKDRPVLRLHLTKRSKGIDAVLKALRAN
ncbi:glucose-6-phosphate isomerase [Antricoccus suffuscus]|uniref:Glucose-6-phosphate isomerase n=1 Tax=Antricoccus suffuscus TaxID=1629062 RepID=A0A2T1A558_9ACTN|nr:glucose-6-phosphate isomerase [Antricoccus suffuscus]PRZ43729.1 glucose-6-phosphate isomerase [Antricoccus suffuscus]